MSSEKRDASYFKRRGQCDKAQKLARYLAANAVTPEDVTEWDDAEWEIWADLVAVKVPSVETRGMVWGLLVPLPGLRKDPDGEVD